MFLLHPRSVRHNWMTRCYLEDSPKRKKFEGKTYTCCIPISIKKQYLLAVFSFCRILPKIQNSLVQGLLASTKISKLFQKIRRNAIHIFEWRFQKYPICILRMKVLFTICKFCFCKTSFGMVFKWRIILTYAYFYYRLQCMKCTKK